MPTQSHHLIPLNVVRDHPLFRAMAASGVSRKGFQLELPDKHTAAAAAAASMAGDIADAAHEGRHWRAYDKLVSAYLDRFETLYVEPDGSGGVRIKSDANLDALERDLRSLEVRLADWHTASIDADGKVTSPEIINAKGFGAITDLSVAMANDIDLAELVAATGAAMTMPNLPTPVAQAGDVLGAWGAALEQTRELMAVRLPANGTNDNGCASGAREAA